MTYEVEIRELEILTNNTRNYTGIAPYIEDFLQADLSRSDLAKIVSDGNQSGEELNGDDI